MFKSMLLEATEIALSFYVVLFFILMFVQSVLWVPFWSGLIFIVRIGKAGAALHSNTTGTSILYHVLYCIYSTHFFVDTVCTTFYI